MVMTGCLTTLWPCVETEPGGFVPETGTRLLPLL